MIIIIFMLGEGPLPDDGRESHVCILRPAAWASEVTQYSSAAGASCATQHAYAELASQVAVAYQP